MLGTLSARCAPVAPLVGNRLSPRQQSAHVTAYLPAPHRAAASRNALQNSGQKRRLVRRGLAARADATNGASQDDDVENVVIIGSGPAGYTAAIYAARANLRPLVFEGVNAGGVRGGQLMTTTEVENFPGFPEGITGPDLMDRMRAQAERWGAQLETEDVESVDLSARPFTIRGTDTTVRAHSVIIATGATAKKLGIPSEQQYWSAGISACAICDGASFMFKGQELAVAGGGDTATEEALYLTKYASHVHLLVRSEKMRASKAMQDRVLRHPAVTVHFSTGIEDAYGDGKALQGLHLFNTQTGEKSELPVKGLFYGIGHKPNSDILDGQVELEEGGYVKVHDHCKTSVEGVFSAGDLHDTEWRQAVTAAGSGCMAALSAERFLSERGLAKAYTQQEQAAETTQSHSEAAASTSATSAARKASEEDSFDLEADRHHGQFALRKLYHASSRPIVVLYTAPTCGPCRTLKPIMSKVVADYPGKVHYVEIDIEEDPEIGQNAGVQGTPTVQIFKDKARLQNLPGVKMKREYKALIEPLLV